MKLRLRIIIQGILLSFILLHVRAGSVLAQTNPSPLTLPVDNDWGAVSFSSMPSGFAAWNGVSGASVTTQAAAESSNPTGNATVMSGTPANGGTGGSYGYSASGNARYAVLNSSNATNGANQLAMAINTTGQSNIVLTYDVINVVANAREIGAVCQYRVGTTGSWTTLTSTNNPYSQSGGTAGTVTPVNVILPVVAENQPVVQIRWATWRGSAAGNSSGLAIDNISVSAVGAGPVITGVVLSAGPNYDLGDTATATVTLNAAPDTDAVINVTSGAFATAVVNISAPDTTGEVEVSMDSAGPFTATATADSGCVGSAVSTSFNVIGLPAASFASTGVNTVDDSMANNNGYIEPSENGIGLLFEITNSGTANATDISASLTSLTGTATISDGVQVYPNILIGSYGTNTSPFHLSVSPSHPCGSPINLQLDISSNEGNSAVILALPTCPPVTDLYSPPGDYYLTATGTGATLKSQLHNITSKNYWNGFLSTSSHFVRSYDAAKFGLQVTDLDPNNSSHLILIYTGISVAKVWNASVWNREHSWPDSRGINGTLPAYSDMHHLRPCNPSINSSRGNLPFGTGGGYWDPDHGAPDRGCAARTMFYMNTRYNGTAPNPSLNLTLVNGQPTGSQMGDLAALIQWHYAYPVDEGERRRNHTVFSNILNPNYYQGNRNPYIDHPEYAWTIYGSTPNDSELYFGPTLPADGSSLASVNFGSILVNAAFPSPQSVVLNKTGNNPTTYDVILGGAAVSAAAGPRQTFITGTQTRNISAGLSGTTAIAGLKTGSIIVDNTDLSSAGTGKGSADGNDTIDISLTILDHANASFASPTDQNELTIDFGDVEVGGSPAMIAFSVHNAEAPSGFTAGLDLDSIIGSGDTDVLTTDLIAFTNLTAGSGNPFSATLNPIAIGDYSATYTLHSSDADLPGAQNGSSLQLNLIANVVAPACAASDVNCDVVVDDADLSAMVQLLLEIEAPCSACAGDMNDDQILDGDDIQGLVDAVLGL